MSDVYAPECWKPTTLAGIVSLVRTKFSPSPNDTEIRCVNLEDMPEASGGLSGWSSAAENLSIKTAFKRGDILFGKLRPYLRKYALAPFDGVCTTEVLAFRTVDGVHPPYAFQVVASDAFIEHNVGASYGTKMPRTDWKTAAAFPLMLPPLDDQRRIADLLSAVDEQVALTDATVAKESVLVKGLMQARIPEGFRIDSPLDGSLADALHTIEAGKSFMCSDKPATEGQWGVLKVSAVRPTGFDNAENKLVEDLTLVNSRYEVRQGDLLITRANTPELVGAACLVDAPQSKLLLCDKTLRLVPKEEAVAAYLWLWLQTPVVRRHVDAHATGTSAGMKNIGQSSLRRIPLCLPSPEEQTSRAAPVLAQLAHIRELRAVAHKLRNIKAGLMADLLTGPPRTAA